MLNVEFMCGIAGFAGFECLKIYKRVWAQRDLVPRNRMLSYLVSLFGIALFCGFVSSLVATGNLLESIFIGFSIPSSAKAIFEPTKTEQNKIGVSVDDVELIETPQTSFFQSWYNLMFSFT